MLNTLGKVVPNLNERRFLPGTVAAISLDGSRILNIAEGNKVRLWDVNGDHELAQLQGQRVPILLAVFSPDSKHLFVVSTDKIPRILDATSGKLVTVLSEKFRVK